MMIDRKAALLRVITCAIGGAVFLLAFVVLRSFINKVSSPYEIVPCFRAHVWGYNFVYPVGALLGLVPGIAWAMDQKSAQRRFLGCSIAGAAIGFILSMASNRAEPMIVFVVAGVYAGVVLALKRLGIYKAEEDNRAGEVSQVSE